MKLLSGCYFFIFLFFIGTTQVSADDGLSLKEALRVAFDQNPDMVQARHEIAASKGRWLESETLPDIEMSVDIGGLRKGGDDTRHGHVDVFSAKQPLTPLGTRFLRGRIGAEGITVAEESLRHIWASVATEIRKNYARILAQEKALEVANENIQMTRQFLLQIETRFQSGNALQSEVLRAKIENTRAENEFLVTQKEFKISKGELNLLLGQAVTSDITLSDVLSYEPLHFQYQGLVEQALKERADIKIEQAELQSAKKRHFMAWLESVLPKMSVGVERTMEDFENDTSIVLEASYPIWGLHLGKVRAAKAEQKKQKEKLEALLRQVNLDVYAAFLEAELADRQVLIHKKSLDATNELLRQITIQYEEGEAHFLSFLENIQTIKETRLAYFSALKTFQEKVGTLEKAIQAIPIPQEKTP